MEVGRKFLGVELGTAAGRMATRTLTRVKLAVKVSQMRLRIVSLSETSFELGSRAGPGLFGIAFAGRVIDGATDRGRGQSEDDGQGGGALFREDEKLGTGCLYQVDTDMRIAVVLWLGWT